MTRTLLILLIGGLLLAGCQDPPRGDTGGRIDPYETTKDERYSTGANIAALLEFSDETAAKLARDLAEIPEIKESSRKVVLELGGINNQTHTPSSDFEMMQQRVRSHLMRSQLLRDHFLIVESRSSMNRELERVQAAPSQQSGGQTS